MVAGRETSKAVQVGVAIAFVVVVAAVAALGGLSTDTTTADYMGLERPSWAPPGWLFGPVWSVLYLGIAAAGWLVWRERGVGTLLGLWGLQMALNAAWTPLFFGLGQPAVALVDIIALWFAIAVCIGMFWRASRVASGLFVPYLAWVSFATALNAAIVSMN